ncbi:MAG: hypothetical protein JJU11_13675, partial [Candidatus Sumerlaeia bacterium]|nr:hypothetical protein [Candidatus Sumerlaeia bacterium]
MKIRFFHFLPIFVLVLSLLPQMGLAITLQPLPAPISNIEGQTGRYAIYTERYGSNAGLIHVVSISPNPNNNNQMQVRYVREQSPNTRNFGGSTLMGTFARDANPGSVDLVVDSAGVAHMVWLANEGSARHIFYGRAGAAPATGPVRVTPNWNTAAATPRVAAARLSSSGAPTPFIAYSGNFTSGGTVGTDILVLSGSPGNAGTWSGPVNLSGSVSSTERDLVFDLIDSLPSTGGVGANIVAQGAIVYESGNNLYTIHTTGSGGTQLFFSNPQLLSEGFEGQLPALVVQSLFGGSNGYVGHVAFRGTSGGIPSVQYLQFAPLPTGNFNVERFNTPAVGSFPGPPMIAVDPDNTVANRQNKRVSIAWQDTTSQSVYVVRNDGGFSSSFGLFESSKPVTAFSGQGQLGPSANVRGAGRFGRYFSGTQWKEVLPVNLNGSMMLAVEDAPPPTPSPTPSMTPTPVPTISPTASPTP